MLYLLYIIVKQKYFYNIIFQKIRIDPMNQYYNSVEWECPTNAG
jgi:hypothetical protein